MNGPALVIPYHQDPGHGWIEVPARLLADLGIADKITRYSYQSRDGRTAYLEEDCDAPRLLDAMKAAGRPFEIREVDHPRECFCCALPRFDAAKVTP
jgi:hypothetical protein